MNHRESLNRALLASFPEGMFLTLADTLSRRGEESERTEGDLAAAFRLFGVKTRA
jgi:hypothetical protein